VRVGLLGGSFDPVHAGHLEVARAATQELALDRVLFLVTARPPHKPEQRFAPALRRYAMVELALLDHDHFFASGLELESRPVYTIETIERLRGERRDDEHVLLLGADSLAGLDGWRRWRELLSSVETGVVSRPGWEWREVEPGLAPELVEAVEAAKSSGRLAWVGEVSHPASASEIRRRIAAREPLPEGWLDPRVLRFVAKHALYR